MKDISVKFKTTSSNRSCISCDRKNCFINQYCNHEWKALLTKNKKTYSIPSGELIFKQGEAVDGIYTVYAGYIKVFESDEHTERIVDLVGAGNILGYRGLGDSSSKYMVSARALTECEVTFFPLDVFKLAILSNPKLIFFLIDLLASKLKKAENQSKNLPLMQAIDKVAYSINTIIDSFGYSDTDNNELSYTLSRRDFANVTGVTYETVIRVLSELDKSGLIKLKGKQIIILDKDYFDEIKMRWG